MKQAQFVFHMNNYTGTTYRLGTIYTHNEKTEICNAIAMAQTVHPRHLYTDHHPPSHSFDLTVELPKWSK